MPLRSQFPDMRDFYSTQFHELAHWSEVRLAWDGSYAMGELVAEMTAAYVANDLGVPQSDDLTNHAKYVQSWLGAMQDDARWIFQAATQASRAADYILSFSRQSEAADEQAAGLAEAV